jgi:hypothetical protein
MRELRVADDRRRPAHFDPAKGRLVVRYDRRGAALLLNVPQLDVAFASEDAEATVAPFVPDRRQEDTWPGSR